MKTITRHGKAVKMFSVEVDANLLDTLNAYIVTEKRAKRDVTEAMIRMFLQASFESQGGAIRSNRNNPDDLGVPKLAQAFEVLRQTNRRLTRRKKSGDD